MSSIKHYKQKGVFRRSLFIVIITLTITVSLIWLLVITKPQPEVNLQSVMPIVVEVVEVEKRSIQPVEEVTGRLHPAKSLEIRFEVAGQVQQKLVQPGSRVKADQVLLHLSAEDYQDQLKQENAELTIERRSLSRDQELLTHARNNLKLQQQEEQRLEKLLDRNLIAQSQLDAVRQQVFDLKAEVTQLEFSVETATARINRQKAQRDMAKRNVDRTQLIAPFDGVINEIMVDEGDFVEVNQTAVTLVDNIVHELNLDVRGELVAALRLEQPLEVLFNNRWLTGRVVALQTDPDPDTNTHQVRIQLQDASLQAGLLAVAKIPLLVRENALLVPVSAVATLQGSYFVYTYADGKVHKTQIKVGERVADQFILLEGISAGQKIVARDVVSLQDQQAVVIE